MMATSALRGLFTIPWVARKSSCRGWSPAWARWDQGAWRATSLRRKSLW